MLKDVFYTGQFTTISVTPLADSDNFDCSKCPDLASYEVLAESDLGHHLWYLCPICTPHRD